MKSLYLNHRECHRVELDRALRAREPMRTFMTQNADEQAGLADSIRRLSGLAAEV